MRTLRSRSARAALWAALAGPACASSAPPPNDGAAPHDAGPARDAVALLDANTHDALDVTERDAAPAPPFCSLGAPVAGVSPPPGFCLRRFATIRSPRTLSFAPNGDLFVGAPTMSTPGGSGGGPGAVVLFTDENRDGEGEAHEYVRERPGPAPEQPVRLADVHGVAVGDGFVYFTTAGSVFRAPYAPGQRGVRAEQVEDLRMPERYAQGRPTHGLARSVTGALYTSGGQVGQSCGGVGTGGIYRATMGSLETMSDGYRNPMYLRCHFRDDVCVATELGEDQTPGAREKIVLIRRGTTYGYPCCFTRGLPMSPACETITAEEQSFPIGDTPFGLDWERGLWPEAFRGALFVALHGSAYDPFRGAGVRYARTDPRTHLPAGEWRELLTGVGRDRPIQRPADAAFAPDGRLFFADDLGNAIYWVAPEALRPSPR